VPGPAGTVRVLIAGGGVAGLEAILALRSMAGDRVELTLVAPEPDFTYRPLAVAEPFSLGRAHRVPLARFADDCGAELVGDAVVGVGDGGREVRLRDGGSRSCDALLLAPGGRPVAGIEGASTWFPGGDSKLYGGLLRDIEEGYAKRLSVVVPPGAVWPLPAYELALMTAGEAREMGQADVVVTVVTPERGPLSLFGEEASAAVAEELRWAGVALRTGAVARVDHGVLVLEPAGDRLEGERVFAVPRILGPGLDGVPVDEEGFIHTSAEGRVEGCDRTWAAGDAIVSPVKFGGLATHQARRAAAAIARLAGAQDTPDPGEPVLEGRLLVGHRTRRLAGRGDSDAAPLWWPAGKIAGEHLPRWLSEHGVAPPAGREAPPGGVAIRRTAGEMESEARYVRDLERLFRSADPAIGSLGRRMREARER
jgi:sulfide:quinone oxidoreductase